MAIPISLKTELSLKSEISKNHTPPALSHRMRGECVVYLQCQNFLTEGNSNISILFELVDLGSGEEEAAGAVVVKVRFGIVSHGLTVFRLLACALYISQVAVGVNGVVDHRIPGFGDHREILGAVENAVVDAPGHAVDKQSGACQLLAAEIAFVVEAHVPESVLALTFHCGLAHGLEVGYVGVAVGIVGGNFVKHTHEGCDHPAIAA